MKHRFRKLEIIIFGVFCLLFAHSLLSLFRDDDGARKTAQSGAGVRNPAAQKADKAASYATQCSQTVEHFKTGAGRVNILGPYCGSTEKTPRPLRMSIVNPAMKATATILNDYETNHFSTDYIPLNSGKNPISLDFEYPGARVFHVDVLVEKN